MSCSFKSPTKRSRGWVECPIVKIICCIWFPSQRLLADDRSHKLIAVTVSVRLGKAYAEIDILAEGINAIRPGEERLFRKDIGDFEIVPDTPILECSSYGPLRVSEVSSGRQDPYS
jgi:hypothetical protein